MYSTLKNFVRKLIPLRLLKKNQIIIRFIIYLFYIGKRHECNICNAKLSKFILLKNNSKLCPKCGSSSRSRQLCSFLIENNLIENKRILHFSPNNSLMKKLKKSNTLEYVTSDYEGEFESQKKLNIESINEPDNYYHLIICYHILEHIKDDNKAMKELYRILRPDGICLIQTPFKEGSIYENNKIKSKEERLKHFGQEDHLRIYSVDGLKDRLKNAGFDVDVKKINNSINNKYGFNKEEIIVIAKKYYLSNNVILKTSLL